MSYLIIITSLSVLLLLEYQYPQVKIHQSLIKHNLLNFSFVIINNIITSFIISFMLVYITIYSAENKIGIIYWLNLPSYISLIIGVLLFDFWQYIWHRLNHKINFFWYFHQIHHSDQYMNTTTSFRFHPIEILLSGLARCIILPLIGINLSQLFIYESIVILIILFHHSSIYFPESIDKIIRIFIVTPKMHRVHHSDYQPYTDSNYASGLSVWDKLFNTYTEPAKINNLRLGLENWPYNKQISIMHVLRISKK